MRLHLRLSAYFSWQDFPHQVFNLGAKTKKADFSLKMVLLQLESVFSGIRINAYAYANRTRHITEGHR